ncbi:MAG TPA: AMP-binding protein [Candidatus Binatia bacterium]|nr:AMP-binding protein [Candidatus Binatia bacterium]
MERMHQQVFKVGALGPVDAFIEFKEQNSGRSIPDCFEHQVKQHPNRLAVKFGSEPLIYEELNRRANRVAHAILAHRTDNDAPVALLFKQGSSIVSASLGVLKAGKVYVPLDYSLPVAKASRILEDFEPRLLLTDEQNLSLASELATSSTTVLNVDSLDAQLSCENPELLISPEDLCYIHYTSGSTGEPKGVVQNHRNEIHNIMTNTNGLRISPDDRISLVRSNNVGATRDTLLALLNGAALFPLDIKEGLADLGQWLLNEEVTVFTCVTSIFRHAVKNVDGMEHFPKLRIIHIGGEAITRGDVELYKKCFSDDCLFVSRLGLSETETLTYFFINKKTDITGDHVPVGYPLEGNEILLLDDDGQDVGVDRVGEIAVRSRYLAVGYWRQPELTRAKFLPDPNDKNVRIYMTGDLGYKLPDGCLVHVGRKDFQVKIRGHRVEVPEVELALRQIPGIKEGVVVPWEDSRGARQLAAYFVAEEGASPIVTQLRSYMNQKLPGYMLPSAFMQLDVLPLTAGGKVDRRALPQPARSRPPLGAPYVEARTTIEKVLINLWAEVIGVDALGIHDDFWELGGDSLLAAQLVSRVNESFLQEFSPNALLEAPTVTKLSALLIERENDLGQCEKIANILLRIDSMSAEQIETAVEDERRKRGRV